MKKFLGICLFFSLSSGSMPLAQLSLPRSPSSPALLFWMSNQPSSVTSFLAHKNKIGIISPPGTRLTKTVW